MGEGSGEQRDRGGENREMGEGSREQRDGGGRRRMVEIAVKIDQ